MIRITRLLLNFRLSDEQCFYPKENIVFSSLTFNWLIMHRENAQVHTSRTLEIPIIMENKIKYGNRSISINRKVSNCSVVSKLSVCMIFYLFISFSMNGKKRRRYPQYAEESPNCSDYENPLWQVGYI